MYWRGGIILALVLAACTDDPARTPDAGGSETAATGPVDRDAWWTGATKRRSGAERILAPRELRALLAEGKKRGLDRDASWWNERATWAYERILTMDPEDLEANAGSGRRTLQSMEGFATLWKRIVEAPILSEELAGLLDEYGPAVESNRPVFLYASEYDRVAGRFKAAKRHLDRLDADPGYANVQRVLASVKTSHLGDYPYLHVRVGPFLVFYAARDLQRIPGEDDAAEDRRLEERRATYRSRLAKWQGVYTEVIEDLKKLYPEIWKDYGLDDGVVFKQWIFGERTWYTDIVGRLRAERMRRPYRRGFYHPPTGWAYMAEPDSKEADESLEETAAYLAARQILRRWAQDKKDRLVNHLDRSEAYWFKEGWPSFIAARRVKAPAVGPLLTRAKNAGFEMPEVNRILERRGPSDAPTAVVGDPGGEEGTFRPGEDGGFTDLAWLLVRHLHGPQHKAAFTRYLRSRLDGSKRGIEWFEECFGIKDAGWRNFDRAVYQGIKAR